MADQFFDLLQSRGLVHQGTEPDTALRERLGRPLTAYIGFDPTADSLHIGSLVPILALRRMQQCGHTPLVVVGGATALVGDPSGKTEARKMLTRDDVRRNAEAIAAQIGRCVRFGSGPGEAALLDNADWLAGMTWIDLLREVGPHFSINRMLSMDSVKGRLESGGISFLEFNYMIMQAYDFRHLHQSRGCTLQMGGSDQWGNIVMGIELARRMDGSELAGLTMPLVTRADGGKFGKSEKGNVWLSAERTPVYDFYQFWRNTADADTKRFLLYFTEVPVADVDALCGEGGAALNAAKERLAIEVTTLLHGAEAADQARDSAKRAFGTQHDVSGDAIPHGPLPAAELASGIPVVELLVRAGLAASKGEAKRLIEGGGVAIGESKVTDITATVCKRLPINTDEELNRLFDPAPPTIDVKTGFLLLRVGKKRMYRFDLHNDPLPDITISEIAIRSAQAPLDNHNDPLPYITISEGL